MGSVDHGKTTLLDYIRKTNVAAREAGGITQSVGAYEIIRADKQITFIDTPGHEAFTKMRARGAQIADIAILVVAADDSVQPQTKEAIKILTEGETPFVVAINKIDRQPDTAKVKNDLMQATVLLEGYGGNVSYQEISAKTGKGVDDLLDLILLAAEMEHLDYDPQHHASGFILETKMDSRRGAVATLIITDGALRLGDEIIAGEVGGKVKILENFLGKRVDSLIPSSPAVVVGFEALPKAGDKFHGGAPEDVANEMKVARKEVRKRAAPTTEGMVNLILKADVAGSLEALSQVIRNLPKKENQALEIIEESVGEITDGDVKLAIPTNAVIIGFRVKAGKAAESLARAQDIKIVRSEIIYDLVKVIEETLNSLGKKTVKGRLEILATFGKKGTQQIIGGEVKAGAINNGSVLEIERKGEVIGTGRVINLQQIKKDVKTVAAGSQCGLLFDSETEIKTGDMLLAH